MLYPISAVIILLILSIFCSLAPLLSSQQEHEKD